MTATDEDLAMAAAGGDRAAFERLLSNLYDRLFGLCIRLTGHRAEAEDLCQDICTSLGSRIQGFKGNARVTTWLYRIAVNAAIDRRRRAASYGKALGGWGDWEENRRRSAEEDDQQINWLYAAMNRLDDPLRDTLALVLDDVSHAEAGEILGISEGTVSWRISQAKQRLREIRLEEEAP